MEKLMHYKDACEAYRRALTLDPSNQELEERVKQTEVKQSECCCIDIVLDATTKTQTLRFKSVTLNSLG